MQSALIGLDPSSPKNAATEHFMQTIKRFQKRGFFTKANLAAVIHPGLFLVPLRWYKEMKAQFTVDSLLAIKELTKNQFEFQTAEILHAESPSQEELVAKLVKAAKKQGSKVLVMASSHRTGIQHWVLGSVCETAVLTAGMPIMIIKPQSQELEYSRGLRMIVGIDVNSPVSKKTLQWIADSALCADAHVDLVYVEPKQRMLMPLPSKSRDKDFANKKLETMAKILRAKRVTTSVTVLEEKKSIAHTIVDFADQRKAWLIATAAVKRPYARKLILGSSARKVLLITKRPFLSIQ